MIFRTYFDKDATLYSGTDFNSGGNPILKLVRGGGVSKNDVGRFIFSFNIEKIKEKIEKKEITDVRKHIIRIYNTMYYNRDVMGYSNMAPSTLPASFKIDIFKINDSWDEGRGYDYIDVKNVDRPLTLSNGVTFDNAKTNIPWSNNAFTFYKTVEFDLGTENLEIDVTDVIESLIETPSIFNGFMIRFNEESSAFLNVVDFYGKDTHTFFEPHLETEWNESINDDRDNLVVNEPKKLYLYANIKNELVNLDEGTISVKIKDDSDVILEEITNVKHEALGVYSIEVTMPDNDGESLNYYDEWSFKYKGITYKIENEFTTVENYNPFSNTHGEPKDYILNVSGIRNNEQIKDDEKRKVVVIAKEHYGDSDFKPSKITMDLYIKNGNQKVFIISNCEFNKTPENYFLYIDFTWLIPQEYWIDIKVHSNGEIRNYEKLSFTLLNSNLINKINEI